MTPEQNKETKHEKMKEKVENIQTEKKKRCDEEKCDCKEQISPEEEKKTVSMTMEEFDAIKLQMAKILNDEKDLEKDFEKITAADIKTIFDECCLNEDELMAIAQKLK